MGKNYVFWFDISMCYALVMQIFNSFSNLFNFYSSLCFLKSLMFFEMIKKCTIFHKLKQKIKILSVVKNSIYFGDAFMVAITLYFDLQCQLLNH